MFYEGSICPTTDNICSFDREFLIEVLANLETLDEILGDVIESSVELRPQQLIEPEMTETVTGRRLKDADGADVPIDADAPDTSYHPPPVCVDECAPTDTSCLCERLANCTKTMTHYDLSVLFAGGYIQNDTSRWVWARLPIYCPLD